MLVDNARLKLAAAAVLLSPYLPLLFMARNTARMRLLTFSPTTGPAATEALREGRKREFAAFDWGETRPIRRKRRCTFKASCNGISGRKESTGRCWNGIKALIGLRRTHPLLKDLSRQRIRADLAGASDLRCTGIAWMDDNSCCVFLIFLPTIWTIACPIGVAGLRYLPPPKIFRHL